MLFLLTDCLYRRSISYYANEVAKRIVRHQTVKLRKLQKWKQLRKRKCWNAKKETAILPLELFFLLSPSDFYGIPSLSDIIQNKFSSILVPIG